MSDALPHNLEAEQALLGAVMFDNGVFERLPDGLRAEHFHEPFHQRLFEVIEAAVRKGVLAEPTLLHDRLSADPAYVEFGGLRYLADLLDMAPPGANAPDYARSVVEHARRRELVRLGGEMIVAAKDPDLSSQETAEEVEGAIYRIMETGQAARGVVTFSEALAGALDMASAAYARDGGLSGLSTVLDSLDRILGGLHPSDLLILAGRPSMGKSALAANIAFRVARRYAWTPDPDAPGGRRTTDGGVVMLYSLEMSAEQMAMRILAEAAGVAGDRMRRGDLNPTEFARIRDAAMEIEAAPLFIDATGGLSLSKLAARARRQKRTTGLDLIVVDYLQLMTTQGRRDANRVEVVSEITAGLKALAKELNVPVLALSQLSRQVEQREDKRPQLSDLRESGSIEQDADVVMFVYREAYYLERAEPREGTDEHLKWQADLEAVRHLAEVIVGKQRHGPIGTVKLGFNPDLTSFTDLTHRYGDAA